MENDHLESLEQFWNCSEYSDQTTPRTDSIKFQVRRDHNVYIDIEESRQFEIDGQFYQTRLLASPQLQLSRGYRDGCSRAQSEPAFPLCCQFDVEADSTTDDVFLKSNGTQSSCTGGEMQWSSPDSVSTVQSEKAQEQGLRSPQSDDTERTLVVGDGGQNEEERANQMPKKSPRFCSRHLSEHEDIFEMTASEHTLKPTPEYSQRDKTSRERVGGYGQSRPAKRRQLAAPPSKYGQNTNETRNLTEELSPILRPNAYESIERSEIQPNCSHLYQGQVSIGHPTSDTMSMASAGNPCTENRPSVRNRRKICTFDPKMDEYFDSHNSKDVPGESLINQSQVRTNPSHHSPGSMLQSSGSTERHEHSSFEKVQPQMLRKKAGGVQGSIATQDIIPSPVDVTKMTDSPNTVLETENRSDSIESAFCGAVYDTAKINDERLFSGRTSPAFDVEMGFKSTSYDPNSEKSCASVPKTSCSVQWDKTSVGIGESPNTESLLTFLTRSKVPYPLCTGELPQLPSAAVVVSPTASEQKNSLDQQPKIPKEFRATSPSETSAGADTLDYHTDELLEDDEFVATPYRSNKYGSDSGFEHLKTFTRDEPTEDLSDVSEEPIQPPRKSTNLRSSLAEQRSDVLYTNSKRDVTALIAALGEIEQEQEQALNTSAAPSTERLALTKRKLLENPSGIKQAPRDGRMVTPPCEEIVPELKRICEQTTSKMTDEITTEIKVSAAENISTKESQLHVSRPTLDNKRKHQDSLRPNVVPETGSPVSNIKPPQPPFNSVHNIGEKDSDTETGSDDKRCIGSKPANASVPGLIEREETFDTLKTLPSATKTCLTNLMVEGCVNSNKYQNKQNTQHRNISEESSTSYDAAEELSLAPNYGPTLSHPTISRDAESTESGPSIKTDDSTSRRLHEGAGEEATQEQVLATQPTSAKTELTLHAASKIKKQSEKCTDESVYIGPKAVSRHPYDASPGKLIQCQTAVSLSESASSEDKGALQTNLVKNADANVSIGLDGLTNKNRYTGQGQNEKALPGQAAPALDDLTPTVANSPLKDKAERESTSDVMCLRESTKNEVDKQGFNNQHLTASVDSSIGSKPSYNGTIDADIPTARNEKSLSDSSENVPYLKFRENVPHELGNHVQAGSLKSNTTPEPSSTASPNKVTKAEEDTGSTGEIGKECTSTNQRANQPGNYDQRLPATTASVSPEINNGTLEANVTKAANESGPGGSNDGPSENRHELEGSHEQVLPGQTCAPTTESAPQPAAWGKGTQESRLPLGARETDPCGSHEEATGHRFGHQKTHEESDGQEQRLLTLINAPPQSTLEVLSRDKDTVEANVSKGTKKIITLSDVDACCSEDKGICKQKFQDKASSPPISRDEDIVKTNIPNFMNGNIQRDPVDQVSFQPTHKEGLTSARGLLLNGIHSDSGGQGYTNQAIEREDSLSVDCPTDLLPGMFERNFKMQTLTVKKDYLAKVDDVSRTLRSTGTQKLECLNYNSSPAQNSNAKSTDNQPEIKRPMGNSVSAFMNFVGSQGGNGATENAPVDNRNTSGILKITQSADYASVERVEVDTIRRNSTHVIFNSDLLPATMNRSIRTVGWSQSSPIPEPAIYEAEGNDSGSGNRVARKLQEWNQPHKTGSVSVPSSNSGVDRYEAPDGEFQPRGLESSFNRHDIQPNRRTESENPKKRYLATENGLPPSSKAILGNLDKIHSQRGIVTTVRNSENDESSVEMQRLNCTESDESLAWHHPRGQTVYVREDAVNLKTGQTKQLAAPSSEIFVPVLAPRFSQTPSPFETSDCDPEINAPNMSRSWVMSSSNLQPTPSYHAPKVMQPLQARKSSQAITFDASSLLLPSQYSLGVVNTEGCQEERTATSARRQGKTTPVDGSRFSSVSIEEGFGQYLQEIGEQRLVDTASGLNMPSVLKGIGLLYIYISSIMWSTPVVKGSLH